ncbi:hypothetical protein D9M70_475010 [compost metagenome]
MIATCARMSLSMVMPSGMNSGSMTVAMNRMLINGTPRTISMKLTPRMRMAGRLEARASASAIPSGSAQARPMKESMKESGSPPHCVVGTTVRPKNPPAISI